MSSVPIYVGRWQDHSRGPVLDDTITLNVRLGGYLVTALATFIGLVGSALWVIVAFLLHQSLTNGEDNDAVFYQHQITYRNPATATATIWEIFCIFLNWRKKTPTGPRVTNLKRRSVFRSIPPFLVFIGITIASVFVSEVAGPAYLSNSVKIKPERCGYWDFNTTSNVGLFAEGYKSTNDTLAARQYARSCYHSQSTSTNCALYPVQSVPYTSSMVACPFSNDPDGHELCLPSRNMALQMDTGFLDTDSIFGINAAPKDRLLFRNMLTCAPIRTSAYLDTTSFVETDGSKVWVFFLGAIKYVTQWTYAYKTQTVNDIVSYQITPFVFIHGEPVEAWTPVPALEIPNGDVSIHFLASNTVTYSTPVEDIWFKATTPLNSSDSELALVTYQPDQLVSVMGCVDQYQICNPNSSPSICSIVGSQLDLQGAVPQLGLNSYQTATAKRILRPLSWTSTYQIVMDLTSQALLAADLARITISPGLPDNQWQLEVKGWFETSLAKLQDQIIQFPVNSADLGKYGSVIAPNASGSPEEQALFHFCTNQRVRNFGGYRSFSFLGIMVVVVVGVAVILVSWSLEYLCVRVRRRRSGGQHDYREVARVADRSLQLHRMALVGAGYRDVWEQGMDDIPITVKDSLLPPPRRQEPGAMEYHYASLPADDKGSEKMSSEGSPSGDEIAPDQVAVAPADHVPATPAQMAVAPADDVPVPIPPASPVPAAPAADTGSPISSISAELQPDTAAAETASLDDHHIEPEGHDASANQEDTVDRTL